MVFPTFQFKSEFGKKVFVIWATVQIHWSTEIQIHWATDHRSDQFMIRATAAPPSNSQTLSGHWQGSHKFTSVLNLSTWECPVPRVENSVPQDAPTSDANCRSMLSPVLLTNWLQISGFHNPSLGPTNLLELLTELRKSVRLPSGSHLWVGKILWRRKWQPTPVF